MPARLDITGERYGDLVALERVANKTYPCGQVRSMWRLRCDCGTEVVRSILDVRARDTKSCGCRKHKSRPAHNRLPDGESSFNCLLSSYKRRAAIKGVPFALSTDEFRALTAGECIYCGAPPAQTKMGHRLSNGAYKYNGIDRVDSRLGYTKDNAVSCCGRCNVSKNDMPQDEFFSWIARVYERCL